MLSALLIALQLATTTRDFGSIGTFRCDFTDVAGRAYSEGGDTPSAAAAAPLKGLVFDRIDYRQRRAIVFDEAGGRAGAVSVTVLLAERATSFVGTSADGNPMLMTVFRAPRPHDPNLTGMYFAAMSRHASYSDGRSAATQLYGMCRGV